MVVCSNNLGCFVCFQLQIGKASFNWAVKNSTTKDHYLLSCAGKLESWATNAFNIRKEWKNFSED